jgi:hypothetical protein
MSAPGVLDMTRQQSRMARPNPEPSKSMETREVIIATIAALLFGYLLIGAALQFSKQKDGVSSLREAAGTFVFWMRVCVPLVGVGAVFGIFYVADIVSKYEKERAKLCSYKDCKAIATTSASYTRGETWVAIGYCKDHVGSAPATIKDYGQGTRMR